MIEPRLVRRESVLGLHFVFGKCIEQPHALVGVNRVAEAEHDKREKKDDTFHHETPEAGDPRIGVGWVRPWDLPDW